MTINKSESHFSKFYIVDHEDLYDKDKQIKVMCSTLGGLRFYSIDSIENIHKHDNVDVLEYDTYNNANTVLTEHYSNPKSSYYIPCRRLGIMSIKTDSTISTEIHPAVRTEEELKQEKLFSLMSKFEDVYVKLNPSWTLHAMSTRRHDTKPEYVHVDIQKAFKAFMCMYDTIKK